MKIFDMMSSQGYLFDWADAPDKNLYKGLLLPNTITHSVSGGFGVMVFQNVARAKYQIWFSNYKITRRIVTLSRADVKMIELSFLIQNNISYELRQGNINHKQWQFNLMNSLAMDSRVQFEENCLYTTLDFHISRDLLESFFEDYPDLVGPFLNGIDANRELLFFKEHLFATPQMIKVVEIILHLLSEPQLNGLLLDLCVTLLLGFAITAKFNTNQSNARYDRKQEIEYRLNAVLAKMLSDLKLFKGISAYAREAGMSSTAFKQNFVKTYGMSPMDVWQKERITSSFAEVVSSDKSITKIAYDYGYGDNAAFTKAFKKEYHLSPSFYRKAIHEDRDKDASF